uniref:Uncharacterized protein n=1 Tax=Salix viminalis TaxID=40686 RepID=A0A6N2MUR5_SALVM
MRQDRPSRYGDVFKVSGDLATRTGSTRGRRSVRKAPYLDRPRGVVQLLPCNLLHRNEQAGFFLIYSCTLEATSQ